LYSKTARKMTSAPPGDPKIYAKKATRADNRENRGITNLTTLLFARKLKLEMRVSQGIHGADAFRMQKCRTKTWNRLDEIEKHLGGQSTP